MQERLKRVQEKLVARGLDAMVVEDTTTFYYLTGLIVSCGICLITKNSAHVIVDGRYFESAQKNSPFPVTLRQAEALKKLIEEEKASKIGFDSSCSTYAQYLAWKEAAPASELVPVDGLYHELRMIKDEQELNALREAAELGSRGFDFGVDLLREGLREDELARELELFWLREGGDGIAFEPIIAFGSNSSMPHYRASDTQLKEGMTVQMDIGVTLNHYHSDMSRVVFYGEPDPRMLEIYEVVKEAQQAGLDACKPGAIAEEIDAAARGVIEKAGYGDLFSHSLGHGVGLDVHEQPYLRPKKNGRETKIESGMVVTVEPGIYLPDVGGVRIEDTVIITNDGHQNLTNRPKELTVIHLK